MDDADAHPSGVNFLAHYLLPSSSVVFLRRTGDLRFGFSAACGGFGLPGFGLRPPPVAPRPGRLGGRHGLGSTAVSCLGLRTAGLRGVGMRRFVSACGVAAAALERRPRLAAADGLGCLFEHERDVAGPLANPGDAASRTGAPALERRALVHPDGADDELVAVPLQVGVRDSAFATAERSTFSMSRAAARGVKASTALRLGHGAAADVLRDEPRLAGRGAHPLGLGANGLCLGLGRCHRYLRFTCV